MYHFFDENDIIYGVDILKSDRKYKCYCGKGVAFDQAASYILEHTDVGAPEDLKVAVVSDRAVSGYYYNRFENQFIERGVKPVLIPLQNIDTGKRLSVVDEIVKYLSDFGFGPCDWLVALGGGGILDAAGFAAYVLDSGISFMAVPTTLNAMVEGSVTSRARLNVSGHKDELSVPFEPDIVLADPTFLETVPAKIKTNGYAPIIRYAILDEPSLILDLESPKDLREYLGRVYESRQRIERSDSRLLTLGDELANAIESYFRFMNYTEGEALALSLLSCVDGRRAEALKKIYRVLGLPVKLTGVSEKMIYKTLKERIVKEGKKDIILVDLLNSDKGRWVVRTLSSEEALSILQSRLRMIVGEEDK